MNQIVPIHKVSPQSHTTATSSRKSSSTRGALSQSYGTQTPSHPSSSSCSTNKTIEPKSHDPTHLAKRNPHQNTHPHDVRNTQFSTPIIIIISNIAYTVTNNCNLAIDIQKVSAPFFLAYLSGKSRCLIGSYAGLIYL